GRTEQLALQALVAQAARYAAVAARAGQDFPAPVTLDDLGVVERVTGDGSTSFGVPGRVTEADLRPVTSAQANRLSDILQAAWDTLADVVAAAPAELRKGPRGGGRDRDKVGAHVEDAERSYTRSIGMRPATDAPMAEVRAEVMTTFRLGTDGSPLPGGTWPLRYAARRFAWHVLDHAWEIEDKSVPER
ncbi:MAG: hypothetical protein LH650_03740, partial [Chloroflexi bacterium]|nr:hypothetical protein [Chloroflexota bacterium]